MKEIVVLSGKGGTGKTTLTGVFATLGRRAVLADADVDASNLHLILNPVKEYEEPFYGSQQPVVDQNKCTRCGVCTQLCRFDAIYYGEVDELNCEGCGVCFHGCPERAITMEPVLSGHLYRGSTPYGPFVWAELGIAQEASGKLVARVKEVAREIARQGDRLLVVDGPPGIGCPVIASVSGASLVLAVTEPTAAGKHDLERLLSLTRHFGIPLAVCLNKASLDEEMADKIEKFCREEGVEFLGRIPFAREVVKALTHRRPVTEGPVAEAMREVWRRALSLL
ncbi:ATP-binding protein [Ammonifex thiophilus]|uniref:(4Fe-4S)-binding protein n=1 Tax=Ammonifex thiophilus TaxID=444093 RepID=A0A3D8P716_9THEO|nr:ATP-binding protein [Ammonifex thiophilus]RDV84028.1 (4Fe-4S)-binding protein [Ammonifex thiophilus]